MTGFAERMFQLGLEALAEQERQVAEVRTRGSALLAAGAVIASLLVKPVFQENHSHDALETFAAVVGLLGASGLLVFVVMLLRPYELGFTINAPATYHVLWDDGILGQPMMDLALADAFEKRREMNSGIVGRLSLFLGLALGALVLETAGLAAAVCARLVAMADRPINTPSPPSNPANAPAPGSIPKLPQTIFNLEKKGGSSHGLGVRRKRRK